MTKLVPLAEAVTANIHDGAMVFVGGFGQCIPFAIAHEIVRQEKRRLTLCRSGADIVFDLLIGAGCVSKVIVGYLGNPGIGLAHAFRRAVEAGDLEVEDWTNFSILLRLHAARLGVPFLPAATLSGGDLPPPLGVKTIDCPYTGEHLTAVPALHPDVAIVHAERADEAGNLQLRGLPGDTVEGALASRRIVATVEEIVPAHEIRESSDRTILPGFLVSSVSRVRFGAYPSYVQGRYGRDDEAYAEWDAISRDSATLAAWLKTAIRDEPDFPAYLRTLAPGRLATLTEAYPSGAAL